MPDNTLNLLSEDQQTPRKGALSGDLQKAPTPDLATLAAQLAALQADNAAMRAELDALKATPAALPPGPGHPDQWDSTGRLISSDYLNLN